MNRSRVTGDLASHGNIFVDIANDRVGIGSTIPGQKLSLPDNAKIALGNSADLQISHDGSHSIIQNTTGLLVLQDTSGLYLRSDDIRFQSDGGSETYATLTKNGAVSLNFDNNNRFQTKDYGVEVIGTTDTDGLVVSGVATCGSSIQVGTDASGKLTFDGANTLAITGPEGGAARIDFIADQGDDAADKWRITNTSGNLFKIQRTTSHTDAVSIDTSGNITFSANSNVDGALRVNTNRTLSTQFHVVGGTGSGTAYDAAVFAGGVNSTQGSGVKLHLSGCENNPLSRGVVLESIMTDNSNAHRFSVKVSGSSAAPTERFRIDAGGNVLIKGYTLYGSGSGNLQVHDSTLILSKTGTGTRNWRFVNNNVSAGNLGLQCSTTDNGGTTYGNMIEITKAGQVGINEGSPDRELVVRGSSNSTIKIKAANTHTSQIFFSDTDAENPARISLFHGTGQSTSGHLLFDVGGNTVLTLKSDQNILHTKASANPNFTLSRNASIGNDEQVIGVIDFASNTAHTVQSRIMARNHGTSNVGGLLSVETRVEGGSLTEKLRITGIGDIYAGNADTGGYAFFDNSTLRPRYQFRQGTGTHRGFAIIETRGDANGQDVFIAKSREGNGTGLINAGDNLGKINFAGADGTNMVNGAQIFAYTVSGKTVAANRMPTNLSFRTHDDNTSGLVERLRIEHDGGVSISNAGTFPASTSETLTVQGEGHNGHGTSNTRSVISITGAKTSNTNAMGIWIGARTNENTAVIGTRTSSGNLAVETYNSGWAERFRIRNNGKVVLSNSSGAMLDLQTSAGTGNCWVQLSDSAGNQKGYFGFGSSSNETLYIVQQESADIAVYTGSSIKWKFTTGGSFEPGANDSYDIGSSGNVVRNIFTGDLHLNNLSKEKGNDVDGTNGSWTIQEGQDDLYIINKLNGKKYRIPLEEVN